MTSFAVVTIPLAPVDAVRITILMDNLTDPLLFPTQQVERITRLHHLAKPRVASALIDDGLPDALIDHTYTGGESEAERRRVRGFAVGPDARGQTWRLVSRQAPATSPRASRPRPPRGDRAQ